MGDTCFDTQWLTMERSIQTSKSKFRQRLFYAVILFYSLRAIINWAPKQSTLINVQHLGPHINVFHWACMIMRYINWNWMKGIEWIYFISRRRYSLELPSLSHYCDGWFYVWPKGVNVIRLHPGYFDLDIGGWEFQSVEIEKVHSQYEKIFFMNIVAKNIHHIRNIFFLLGSSLNRPLLLKILKWS